MIKFVIFWNNDCLEFIHIITSWFEEYQSRLVETGHTFCGYYNIIYSSRKQLNWKKFLWPSSSSTDETWLKMDYWNIISEATKTWLEKGVIFFWIKMPQSRYKIKVSILFVLIGGSKMLMVMQKYFQVLRCT